MSESSAASRSPAAVPSRSARAAARSAARQSMAATWPRPPACAAAGQSRQDLAAAGAAGRGRARRRGGGRRRCRPGRGARWPAPRLLGAIGQKRGDCRRIGRQLPVPREAVDEAFGGDVDFAQIIKEYGKAEGIDDERRYSPATCKGMEIIVVQGSPGVAAPPAPTSVPLASCSVVSALGEDGGDRRPGHSFASGVKWKHCSGRIPARHEPLRDRWWRRDL